MPMRKFSIIQLFSHQILFLLGLQNTSKLLSTGNILVCTISFVLSESFNNSFMNQLQLETLLFLVFHLVDCKLDMDRGTQFNIKRQSLKLHGLGMLGYSSTEI